MSNKIERVVSNAVWEITESVENINDVQESNIKTLLNRYGSIVDTLDNSVISGDYAQMRKEVERLRKNSSALKKFLVALETNQEKIDFQIQKISTVLDDTEE